MIPMMSFRTWWKKNDLSNEFFQHGLDKKMCYLQSQDLGGHAIIVCETGNMNEEGKKFINDTVKAMQKKDKNVQFSIGEERSLIFKNIPVPKEIEELRLEMQKMDTLRPGTDKLSGTSFPRSLYLDGKYGKDLQEQTEKTLAQIKELNNKIRDKKKELCKGAKDWCDPDDMYEFMPEKNVQDLIDARKEKERRAGLSF